MNGKWLKSLMGLSVLLLGLATETQADVAVSPGIAHMAPPPAAPQTQPPTPPPTPQKTATEARPPSSSGSTGQVSDFKRGDGFRDNRPDHFHRPRIIGVPYGYYGYYGSDGNYGYTSYGDDNNTLSDPNNVATPPNLQTGSGSWYMKGHDWAQDLRRDVAAWDQFVQYVRTDIINAVPWMYDNFRRGFIDAYGTNADAAFDKAIVEARPEPRVITPKVINVPQAEQPSSK